MPCGILYLRIFHWGKLKWNIWLGAVQSQTETFLVCWTELNHFVSCQFRIQLQFPKVLKGRYRSRTSCPHSLLWTRLRFPWCTWGRCSLILNWLAVKYADVSKLKLFGTFLLQKKKSCYFDSSACFGMETNVTILEFLLGWKFQFSPCSRRRVTIHTLLRVTAVLWKVKGEK